MTAGYALYGEDRLKSRWRGLKVGGETSQRCNLQDLIANMLPSGISELRGLLHLVCLW